MIDQELIEHVQARLDESKNEGYPPEISFVKLQELLTNYKLVIQDNASLHKQLSVLRADKIQVTR
jgi:hypothetical protein